MTDRRKQKQNRTGVVSFLTDHAGRDPVSFHMPGHKGQALYRRFGYGDFLDRFFDCDITEITGADNLFQPEGIIAETMAKYRKLYETAASYLLVNGTSGGLIAAILASVPAGRKLIMARNCHKSVFNALTLGGIQPVYAYPAEVEDYGIAGPVEAAEIGRLIAENPDAEAVILPSPNYYGICSDIRAIAEVVHAAGKILIVDQAHGAHLKFFGRSADGPKGRPGEAKAGPDGRGPADGPTDFPMPAAAEDCGADFVVNSIHKTLGSLTQSAVLNVCGEGRDLYTLEDKLQAIESTSPSYILMGSLDINADLLLDHGTDLIKEWKENLQWFYARATEIQGLKLMMSPVTGDPAGGGMTGSLMDLTKIDLDMSACGLDGGQLEEALLSYEIYAELVTGNILMCMTGIGNTRSDYERLLEALRQISAGAAGGCRGKAKSERATGAFLWTKKRPLHPMPAEKELKQIEDCRGRICAASIIPYPPGIPLICPGEEIGAEEIAYVKELRLRGEKVMGIDSEGRIAVGKIRPSR